MGNTDSPSAASSTDDPRQVAEQPVRIERFAEAHLPLVAAFSEQYWSRPRTEAFYRWRYVESQALSTLYVALTDSACLGMVSALRKTYIIAGQPTPCVEIFDWHSLPGLKGSGVGIRVMRAMMREGARLMGIGGTADAVKALPAMGWQLLGTATMFELPVAGDALRAGLRDRLKVSVPGEGLLLSALAATWFRPRRRRYPDGRALPSATIGDEVAALYEGDTGYDVVQRADPAATRWVASYPGNGAYTAWHFLVRDRVRGWGLTRVYETEAGREAAIVDVFAPKADINLYAWMLSEMSSALVSVRPRVIRARASCPLLQAALRANRFRSGSSVPIFTSPKDLSNAARIHITLNHTDGPFRPYPAPGAATGFLVS
jgi:hypothetical protein